MLWTAAKSAKQPSLASTDSNNGRNVVVSTPSRIFQRIKYGWKMVERRMPMCHAIETLALLGSPNIRKSPWQKAL